MKTSSAIITVLLASLALGLSAAPLSPAADNLLTGRKVSPWPPAEITAQEIICDNTDGGRRNGCSVGVSWDQPVQKAFVIQAASKCENYSFRKHVFYSLRVEALNAAHKKIAILSIPYNTGTHDYEKVGLLLNPKEPVKDLVIHVVFQGKGVAMFKDIHMREATAEEIRTGKAVVK